MRVLLVEDNEINMKLLVAYMRKLKLSHTTAINGLEALNTYKEAEGAFDVIFMGKCHFLHWNLSYLPALVAFPSLHSFKNREILRSRTPSPSLRTDTFVEPATNLGLDISMPIMSGIESTRHIRRFERENSLNPVALIALTGAANPTTRQEAFASGIDLYLTKPIAMKSLKSMLEDLERDGRSGFRSVAA